MSVVADRGAGPRVQATDGHQWTLLVRQPTEPPRMHLLWLPALGVAARHYLPFAEALAARGVAVYLHEWRGNGSSSLRPSHTQDWGYRELLELDLPASIATLPADEQIMKVMMIDPEPQLSRAIAQLPAELYQRYTVVRSSPYFLEFMNKRSNKGTGEAALAEHLGLTAHQVIAVGDAGNDRHMIEYAGLGVAMGNACDEIKTLAQYTTARNDEDGVARVIEQFILNA